MVSERGLQVLRAIVQDYVETNEPVGSKSLVDRYSFGVSAATIRNDMALLEDEELITAPHTSSGRMPTDKGYRVFVDHLAQLRPLSSAQRTAIESFLSEPADLDDLMARTVRVLSRLTGQMAIAQYPSFASAHLSHIELVALAPSRMLVILVTDAGGVSQRITQLPIELDGADLATLREQFTAILPGQKVQDAAGQLAALLNSAAGSRIEPAVQTLCKIISEELGEFRQERLVLAGTATLARREHDFRGNLHPILEAIEEQVTLLRLVSELQTDEHGLAASIGVENEAFGIPEASIVASDYVTAGGMSRVAVMGPTRMDYSGNFAMARAVARYLTRMLDEDEQRR
jgi:heat-inducible transcriptional repressor